MDATKPAKTSKERRLGPLTSAREPLPGEDWIAVQCSCGKMVAAPRGWSFYVKSATQDGECAHKLNDLPELEGKKLKRKGTGR